MEEKGTGLIFAPDDSRDALYGAFEDVMGAFPDAWELERLPFVRDQKRQYSCVMQSISRIHDYANRIAGDPAQVSARYGFAYCKMWDGSPTLNGTFTRTGLDVAIKLGVAHKDKWPDTSSLPTTVYLAHPSIEADISAQPFRISGYVQLNTADQIKDYLTKYNLPVVIGINSNNTGWGNAVVRKNKWTLKEPTGGRTGHLVAVVGWNKTGWRFDNSWGAGWGDDGRATVPYAYSGLQRYAYGAYDLPNNWQDINNNYKETTVTTAEVNSITVGQYRVFLGRDPKPEELKAVQGHNAKILSGLKLGGPAGQKVVEDALRGFVPENKEAVKSGKI